MLQKIVSAANRYTSKPMRNRRLALEISASLLDDERVLDVGCGDGRLTDSISKRRGNAAFFCCDIINGYAGRLKTFVVCDSRQLPFKDGSFGQTIVSDVVHHCPHPDVLIAEALRVTSKNIIIKDHVSSGLIDRALLSLMDAYGNAGGSRHRRYLSQRGWTELFNIFPDIASVESRPVDLYGPLWSIVLHNRLQVVHIVRKNRSA
jgi:SAM-dependent methyltransferase